MKQRQRMEISNALTGNTNARNRTLVVGLGGLLASGKDTVADRLVAAHGFAKIGMSDPLHEALLTLNPIVDYRLGKSVGIYPNIEQVRYADLTNEVGYTKAKLNDEYRALLQRLGTDVARRQWDDQHWTKIAERRIKNSKRNRQPIALTGIRFENEAAMIRRNNGVLIWITRPDLESPQPPSTAKHESETSVDGSTFDIHIDNAGSIHDLYDQIDALPARLTTITNDRWISTH